MFRHARMSVCVFVKLEIQLIQCHVPEGVTDLLSLVLWSWIGRMHTVDWRLLWWIHYCNSHLSIQKLNQHRWMPVQYLVKIVRKAIGRVPKNNMDHSSSSTIFRAWQFAKPSMRLAIKDIFSSFAVSNINEELYAIKRQKKSSMTIPSYVVLLWLAAFKYAAQAYKN